MAGVRAARGLRRQPLTVCYRKSPPAAVLKSDFAAGRGRGNLPGERTGLRAHREGRDWRLLTVAEVAEELAMCTATVYKLVACGALVSVRALNVIRVRRDDIERFAQKALSRLD